jgi:hypothetical protein
MSFLAFPVAFIRRCSPSNAIFARVALVAIGMGIVNVADGACIKPTADVVTAVVLRSAPSSMASRLGTLRPGQSAEAQGSVPGWTRVRSVEGVLAFVSKRWTAETPCTGEAATVAIAAVAEPDLPVPLLAAGHPVTWWFAFKLNSATFPGCGAQTRGSCSFGGSPQSYRVGQQFVYASSENQTLQQGDGCAGTTFSDPLGATFDEAYHGEFHYIVWNDQFKGDPAIPGCGDDCASPWGHSKGMVFWNDVGTAVVLQVTTPSWPGAGSEAHPRASDGNTLGCVRDNNVKYSQHFFALKLSKEDLLKLLAALSNASVATDPSNPQVVSNGGPADVQDLVRTLGHKQTGTTATMDTLSSGIRLISKPSSLHVPPWQLVSSLVGGVPLRAATWWASPLIDSTTAATPVTCWDSSLASPAAVEIATSGDWNGTTIGLKGFVADGNHAKIGTTTDGSSGLVIFGDLNQQGALDGSDCGRSQNGRGGLFFVLNEPALASSVASLIRGESAPVH